MNWGTEDGQAGGETVRHTGGHADPAPGQVMEVGHFPVSSEGPVQAA